MRQGVAAELRNNSGGIELEQIWLEVIETNLVRIGTNFARKVQRMWKSGYQHAWILSTVW
jgi:hypothetical protein